MRFDDRRDHRKDHDGYERNKKAPTR